MGLLKKYKIALMVSSIVAVSSVVSWWIYEKTTASDVDFLSKVKVKKVIDGDTFQDTNNINYRLFGIDAWETTIKVKNNSRMSTKGITYFYAQKAKKRLTELIADKEVSVLKRGQDKYGRIVATIFVQNIDVQKELVKQGLAEVKYISSDLNNITFTNDRPYLDELNNLVYQAKLEKINIWSL